MAALPKPTLVVLEKPLTVLKVVPELVDSSRPVGVASQRSPSAAKETVSWELAGMALLALVKVCPPSVLIWSVVPEKS